MGVQTLKMSSSIDWVGVHLNWKYKKLKIEKFEIELKIERNSKNSEVEKYLKEFENRKMCISSTDYNQTAKSNEKAQQSKLYTTCIVYVCCMYISILLKFHWNRCDNEFFLELMAFMMNQLLNWHLNVHWK